MNGRLATGLALALSSSLTLNAGYLLQHRASTGLPGFEPRHPLASLRVLIGRRRWLGSIALSTFGWALYVAALWFAPLSLVTAFLAGGLALLVPLAGWLLGGRATASERVATCATAGALALLAIGTAGAGRNAHYRALALVLYGVAILALAALALGFVRGSRRPDALGLAAGCAYGLVDVCTKGLIGRVSSQGVTAIFTSPLAYGFGALTIAGFLLFQRGLEGRRPVPAIALMTTGNYAVAIGGGMAVFGDRLGSTSAWTVVHALAFCVAVGSAFVLSSAEARLFAGPKDVTPAPQASAAAHLDLDGALPPGALGLPHVPLHDVGPQVRYCARPRDLDLLRRRAGASLHARYALLGSGDFHHLTAMRLERVPGPLAVVSFDNHPDWDLRPPAWACGAWVCRALALPHVERVAVWGCGNHELRLPSRLFGSRSRRLELFAWEERVGGVPFELISKDTWRERFLAFARTLEGKRTYVTVDVDVLDAEEAATNWESGLLSTDELVWAIERLREAADVVGGDVCGAWSEPSYARRGQRLLAERDHPRRRGTADASVNERTLRRIWSTLTGGSRRAESFERVSAAGSG